VILNSRLERLGQLVEELASRSAQQHMERLHTNLSGIQNQPCPDTNGTERRISDGRTGSLDAMVQGTQLGDDNHIPSDYQAQSLIQKQTSNNSFVRSHQEIGLVPPPTPDTPRTLGGLGNEGSTPKQSKKRPIGAIGQETYIPLIDTPDSPAVSGSPRHQITGHSAPDNISPFQVYQMQLELLRERENKRQKMDRLQQDII